jgi:hypothetical protein
MAGWRLGSGRLVCWLVLSLGVHVTNKQKDGDAFEAVLCLLACGICMENR